MDSFLAERIDPVYLVTEGSGTDLDVARRLRRSGLANPVERVSLDSLSTVTSSAPAGVVCLWTERPSANGRTDPRAAVERVAATEVDCPIVAVGADVDAAAAYDAGASDIVPLDVADHAKLVTEKVAEAVDRSRNERLLSDLIDETADGLLLHDPETGEVLACNDRYYEMLGYDPAADTVTLDGITEADGEFTRDRAVSLIRRAADGTPATFEWKPPTHGGRDTWVEVALEAATLAGRRYVIASVRDIQRRKERERDLKESRATFRRLHEITADPELDIEGRIRELLAFGAAEFGTDIGFLSRIDRERGEVEFVEVEGDHPLIRAGEESALEETYCRRVIESAGDPPVAIRDAEAAGMADDPAYERFGLGCYLGAEVVVNGELFGTLCFADETPRSEPFSEREQTLIDHMAQWLRQEVQQRAQLREIREAQERQQRVLSRIDDAFFALDTEWRVQYVNEAGAEVLRGAMDAAYDDDDLIGRNLWEEIPAAVETTFYDQYHRAMDEQRSVSFEEYYEPLDVWFNVRAYPDADGLSVYFTDITDRKRREQELAQYETILDSLDDAVYAFEPDGTIAYVNERYASMKGVDRETLIGTSVYDWVNEEAAARADAERRQLESGTGDAGTLEYEFRSVDGETTPVEMRFAPVVDTDEGARRVGVIRDVSEAHRNRRIRRQLLSTTEELMNADSRDRIAAIVSDAAASVFGYELNAVYLRDDDAAEPPLSVAARPDGVDRSDGDPISRDPPEPVREALATNDPVVWSVGGSDPDSSAAPEAGVGSLLALPIGDHGVLAVAGEDRNAFGEAERSRAELLTVNAAAAFDRTERTKELEQYETIFETVRDMLYVVDEHGDVERVSQPLAEAAGYGAEELRGSHVSNLLTDETVAEAERRVLDLLVTPDRVSSAFEGAMRSRDGTETPVEIELSLLPHDDQFRGTVGAVRDISERKDRERRLRVFRQALTEAGVGLAMYDETGRFEYVNEHYAQLLGRTRDGVENAPVWEIFEARSRDTFDAYWDSFVLGETRSEETEHRRDDSSTVSVEAVTTAVEVNGTRHHIMTAWEITERQERQQQSEVLQRLIRHNLRNDLTVILGHSQLLEDDLDGSAADSAATIHETAEDLRGLTESVQEAQDIIGRDVVRKPIDVVGLLDDELARLRSDNEVAVERDLPETRFVLADVPLRHALRQLLGNAVEHNDTAVPSVRVGVAPAADRPGWVDIEIADDGSGIPEYEVATLTAGEETSLQHGSGIGLWIVYWAVTRYGGDLEFEHRNGGGSLVRIKLPAATDPGESDESGPKSVDAGEPDE